MSNQIATTNSTEVTTADVGTWSPGQQSDFTNRERDELRAVQPGLDKASDADLHKLFAVCKQADLNPYLKEVYLVPRWSKQGTVWATQTSIDGFRKATHRYAEAKGLPVTISAPVFYDEQGNKRPFWSKKFGDHPEAAEVTVSVGNSSATVINSWDEYVQTLKDGTPNSMWKKMGATMLAKCFTGDTEVLTDEGFIRLDEFGNQRVAQVTNNGLELVEAKYLVQDYEGDMIVSNADMLNFKVTPNHDMVTTYGKVEAGALFETLSDVRSARAWRIPMRLSDASSEDNKHYSDDSLRLAGYVFADGSRKGEGQQATIEVSRPYKIEALRLLENDGEYVRHSKGAIADAGVRQIKSNFDKAGFRFDSWRFDGLFRGKKEVNIAEALTLSPRQAKVLIDAWLLFDGHENRKTGVKRIYTSSPSHRKAIETIAIHAGYSVSLRARTSDIGTKEGYIICLSSVDPIKAIRPTGNQPGIVKESNETGKVYCVTVPSGQIVVRRNGFSMICGNCSEAGAHRRVCPLTAGLYVDEEMQQASNPVPATATVQRQEEPKGDDRPSIEAAVVEDDGWTVDEVVSIIRTATTADELGEQKGFIGQFVSEHPDARDQINAEWAEKSKEFA